MSGAVVPAQSCSKISESSRDGALWRLEFWPWGAESGHSLRDGGLGVSGAVVPAQVFRNG